MPFLVDSVTQELARTDVAIQLVVHPQFVVRRDLHGRLLAVSGTLDAHEAPKDALVESWMHLEVVGPADENAAETLRRDIVRVLQDVRDAVEDWPKMRAYASRAADELDAEPPNAVPAAETGEVVEFLRWLADDHFTFLGYREYRLVDDEGVDALAAVSGTGLGILRADKLRPRPLADLPQEVRARVRDPQLLLITKANSRSTVHRGVYLDYIGIKTFDKAGVVIGERRFLGLFTSVAYTQSVWRIPLLRSKSAAVLELSGFAPRSHSGKDLIEIIEDHPRDEMFQMSVPELYETAMGVLHLQERRRLRLFMRRDVYGRFVSCLVYLPRERYDTAGSAEDAGDPARGTGRLEHRRHVPGRRVGARAGALRRPRRRCKPGRGRPRRTGAPSRRRDPHVGRRLRRRARGQVRRSRRECRCSLHRRVSRGVQGRLRRDSCRRRPATARCVA